MLLVSVEVHDTVVYVFSLGYSLEEENAASLEDCLS